MVNGTQAETEKETVQPATENIETPSEEAEAILAVTADGQIVENKQVKKDGEEETGS